MSFAKCIPHSTIYRIGVFIPDLLLRFRNKVICSKSCRLCVRRILTQSQVGLIPKTMFLISIQQSQKTNLLTELYEKHIYRFVYIFIYIYKYIYLCIYKQQIL